MEILIQPDSLSMVGSMNPFEVYADKDISFVLRDKATDKIIVQHTYTPNENNRVTVKVKDIILPLLSFKVSDSSEPYEQPDILKAYEVAIAEVGSDTSKTVTFSVLRAGVDKLSDSAANFLKTSFLTWQPNVKAVTYYSPEFLTYYAQETCVLMAEVNIWNGVGYENPKIALATMEAGKVWTIPVQYAIIKKMLSGDAYPSYYDVWVESTDGTRLTYVQRYYASGMKSESEEWFLFENSLGGIDCFRAYGVSENTAEHTHNVAEIEEDSEEYRVDTTRKFKKNTGFLDKRERLWLLDFFPSLGKYHYQGSSLRKITVTESDVNYESDELPSDYTFTYKYSDARPYLNLKRTDVDLSEMPIHVPDLGNFTIAPRLVEFSRLTLSGGALFPVQSPYSEEWGTTTLDALYAQLVAQLADGYKGGGGIGHTHNNFDLLSSLSEFLGYILMNGEKLKAGTADTSDDFTEDGPASKKILRKDKDDEANEIITFLKGLRAKGIALLDKGVTLGDEASINEFGDAALNSIRSIDYDNAAEQGFSIEKEKSGKYHAFLTNLTVWGKAIFHELEIRKLSYAGGNIYLSGAGSKLVKVAPVVWNADKSSWVESANDECEGWKCYLLADNGTTATMNYWQEGDQVRCQTTGEIASGGTYTDESNKSYWRTIVKNGVSHINEKIYDQADVHELYGGQAFAWIVIGKHSVSLDGYTEDNAPTETRDIPAEGDTIVLDGNRHRNDKGEYDKQDRQNVIVLETTGDSTGDYAPRIACFANITEYKHTVTKKVNGKDTEVSLSVFETSPKGGTKINSSRFEWISDDGSTVNIINYRGDWVSGNIYRKNDQVNHANAVWVCVANSGVDVTEEPSDASANWKKVIVGGKNGDNAYAFAISLSLGKMWISSVEVNVLKVILTISSGNDFVTVSPDSDNTCKVYVDGVLNEPMTDSLNAGRDYLDIYNAFSDEIKDKSYITVEWYSLSDTLRASSSFSLSRKGEDGRGIIRTETKYWTYDTDSGVAASTIWSNGSTTMPTGFDDTSPWLWSVTMTYYTDDTSSLGEAVCIGYKAKNGNPGKDGASAIEITVSPDTLVFDTDSSGLVSSSVSKNATITCKRDGKDITSSCSFTLSGSGVNCSASISSNVVTISKITSQTVDEQTVSNTSGYAMIGVNDGKTSYFAQVKFAVNVAKFNGSLVSTNKELKSSYTEVSNKVDRIGNTVDGLPLKTSDELTKYTSEIQQTARNISLEVSQKQMGRRNLLVGSAFRRQNDGAYVFTYGAGSIEKNTGINGVNCAHFVNTYDGNGLSYTGVFWDGSQAGTVAQSIRIERGKKYTVSCWVKCDRTDALISLETIYTDKQTGATRKTRPQTTNNNFRVSKANVWELFSCVIDTSKNNDGTENTQYDYIAVNVWCAHTLTDESGKGVTVNAYFCKPMLEEGDTYNGWTLSEQDYDYVGGNLLDNVRTTLVGGNLNEVTATLVENGYGDCNVRAHVLAEGSTLNEHDGEVFKWKFDSTVVTREKDYMFSFMAKCDSEGGRIVCYLWKGDGSSDPDVIIEGSNGYVSKNTDGSIAFDLTPSWKRYWVHWRPLAAGGIPQALNVRHTGIYVNESYPATKVYVCQPKLEEGATMTEWTERKTDLIDKASLKAAGINITSSAVELYGDQVKVSNTKGGTPYAMFSNGKLNADLIDADKIEVKHLWAKSEDGSAKVGYIGNAENEACKVDDKTYAPLFVGASNAAKSPFYVTTNGHMVSKSATLGNWTLTPGELSYDSGFEDPGMTLANTFQVFREYEKVYSSSAGKWTNELKRHLWVGGLDFPYLTYNKTSNIYVKDSFSKSGKCTIGLYVSVEGSDDSVQYDNNLYNGKVRSDLYGNFAVWAEKGMYAGLRPAFRTINRSVELTEMDCVVRVVTNDITLTLPDSPQRGQYYKFIQGCSSGFKIVSPSNNLYWNGADKQTSFTSGAYNQTTELTFDGTNWFVNWFRQVVGK